MENEAKLSAEHRRGGGKGHLGKEKGGQSRSGNRRASAQGGGADDPPLAVQASGARFAFSLAEDCFS